VSQLALSPAAGYPGFNRGLSLGLFVPAALGMFVAPQVALVSGTLAVLRALRRRRARTLPAAELALIRRRARIGLNAGIATVIGLELYVVDFSSVLPGWWLALVGGLAGIGGVALAGASRRLAAAGAIVTATSGSAGDVFDDLPALGWSWLRRWPWRLGAIASLGVGVGLTLVGWHAEHSLIEGIERGAFEGLAAAAGFGLLGRAIGVLGARSCSEHPLGELGIAALEASQRHLSNVALGDEQLGRQGGEQHVGDVVKLSFRSRVRHQSAHVQPVHGFGHRAPDASGSAQLGVEQQIAVGFETVEHRRAKGGQARSRSSARTERRWPTQDRVLQLALTVVEDRQRERRPVPEAAKQRSLAHSGLRGDRLHRRAAHPLRGEHPLRGGEDAQSIPGRVGTLGRDRRDHAQLHQPPSLSDRSELSDRGPL